jgi:hypothetical protein
VSATLWFDRTREHVWRVPDDVELPPGDLEIRSFDGATARVHGPALTEWLLEKDQARKAVFDDLSASAAHAGRALSGVAAGWWAEARGAVPEDWSWSDLERRLGPMEEWFDRAQAQDTVQQGREALENAAREARATWKRAARVARSAATSGWAVGKVVLDNPELAETASRWAESLAGKKKPHP